MATVDPEEKPEIHRGRHLRREERRAARSLARRRIAEVLHPLLEEPAPRSLTPEQGGIYAAELRRLVSRALPQSV